MPFLLLIFATFLAALIGTLTGFGTSTLLVPLVLTFLPPAQTLLLVGIIHWFGDLWKVILFRHGIRRSLLLYFALPGIITTVFAAYLALILASDGLTNLIGWFLVIYSLFLILSPTFAIPPRPVNAILGGALYGFLAGLTGLGGPIRSAFLSALNLKNNVYLATSGMIGISIDTFRLITYIYLGTRLSPQLNQSLFILIPLSFIAAELAKLVVTKLPHIWFRRLVSLFLALAGIKLILS